MEPTIDSKKLEKLIEEKFGTQIAFAKAANVTRQYVSLVVKGERTPSLQKLMNFADMLGVDVSELLVKEVALAA